MLFPSGKYTVHAAGCGGPRILRKDRKIVADPRNVAHDKKVQEEKKHHGEEAVEGAAVTPQPGKKPPLEHHASDDKEDVKDDGEA